MGANEPGRRSTRLLTAVCARLPGIGVARLRAKPSYGRWWFRAPAVLMVLVIFGAADNFGDPSTAAPSTSRQSTAAKAPLEAKPADKGWVLESIRFPAHGIGDGNDDFAGTARITNTNKTAASAIFTITVLMSGLTVASLPGFATDVSAGKTVTVSLISQDDYQPGPFTVVFQTDASYH